MIPQILFIIGLLVLVNSQETQFLNQCQTVADIASYGFGGKYCIKIGQLTSPTSDCGIKMDITKDGKSLASRELDTSIEPEVCTDISGTSCKACAVIENLTTKKKNGDNLASGCASLKLRCTVLGSQLDVVSYPVSSDPNWCFSDQKVLASCGTSSCPTNSPDSVCSGNGSCNGGICHCESGFTGLDCGNESVNVWKQCVGDVINAPICAEMTFDTCSATVDLYAKGPRNSKIEILNREVKASNMKQFFQTNICQSSTTLGNCAVCLNVTDFKLTDTEASGCPKLSVSCSDIDYTQSWSLDCFKDTNIVPTCFSGCENDCNGHGTCKNGFCECNSGYDSTSYCKNKLVTCPACGVHGTCNTQTGICSCDKQYSGSTCSIFKGAGSSIQTGIHPTAQHGGVHDNGSRDHKSSNTGTIIFAVLGGITLASVVAGVAFFLYRKKQQKTVQYGQLDEITEDPILT